jgi:hypothetical protein
LGYEKLYRKRFNINNKHNLGEVSISETNNLWPSSAIICSGDDKYLVYDASVVALPNSLKIEGGGSDVDTINWLIFQSQILKRIVFSCVCRHDCRENIFTQHIFN